MVRSLRRLGVLFVLALLAAALPFAPVRAQNTYEVAIGSPLMGGKAESTRFFPSSIRVHQGDVLHFTTTLGAQNTGLHSATHLPGGVHPDDWIPDNATGPTAPFSLVVLDPDETPATAPAAVKVNNAVALPSDLTCGQAGMAPCAYDGNGVLNTGLPAGAALDFSVEITASPGEVIWVLCLVHVEMRMRIEVVDDTDTASDPAAIAAQKAEQVARDEDTARALDAALKSRNSSHETANGNVVHDAWAGFDTNTLVIFKMYPKKLTVDKGDTVRWHFGQLRFEDHTVTFPLDRGLDLANGFPTPQCDPDGDAGTMPDTDPDMPPPLFCSGGLAQLELDLPHDFPFPAGNGRLTGVNDFENSGGRGNAAGNENTAPYDLRFTKKSPKDEFRYVCIIHPSMRGRVVVK